MKLSPYLYTYSAACAREDEQAQEAHSPPDGSPDFGISDFEVREETFTIKIYPKRCRRNCATS